MEFATVVIPAHVRVKIFEVYLSYLESSGDDGSLSNLNIGDSQKK